MIIIINFKLIFNYFFHGLLTTAKICSHLKRVFLHISRSSFLGHFLVTPHLSLFPAGRRNGRNRSEEGKEKAGTGKSGAELQKADDRWRRCQIVRDFSPFSNFQHFSEIRFLLTF